MGMTSGFNRSVCVRHCFYMNVAEHSWCESTIGKYTLCRMVPLIFPLRSQLTSLAYSFNTFFSQTGDTSIAEAKNPVTLMDRFIFYHSWSLYAERSVKCNVDIHSYTCNWPRRWQWPAVSRTHLHPHLVRAVLLSLSLSLLRIVLLSLALPSHIPPPPYWNGSASSLT